MLSVGIILTDKAECSKSCSHIGLGHLRDEFQYLTAVPTKFDQYVEDALKVTHWHCFIEMNETLTMYNECLLADIPTELCSGVVGFGLVGCFFFPN